jgi:hypothetical protein
MKRYRPYAYANPEKSDFWEKSIGFLFSSENFFWKNRISFQLREIRFLGKIDRISFQIEKSYFWEKSDFFSAPRNPIFGKNRISFQLQSRPKRQA